MTVVLPSANSAVERLLVVNRNHPGNVHRMVRDETLPGGKPVNVARVLQALDGQPSAPWLVGLRGGATGELFAAGIAREELDGEWISTAADTRVCEVLVDLAHPYDATVYNAVGAAVTEAEAARLDTAVHEAISDANALACTGSIVPGVPANCYANWIAAANRAGIPSLVDTTGVALLSAAAQGPTIVKINADELHLACDGDTDGLRQEWERAGVTAVVVTDGNRPTVALTPEGAYCLTPPQVEVVSAVGSGDAFTAGLLHSYLAGGQWPDHLRLAAVCGAANAGHAASGLTDSPESLENLAQRVTVEELSSYQTRYKLARHSSRNIAQNGDRSGD